MTRYRIKQINYKGKVTYIPQRKSWYFMYEDIIEDDIPMVFYSMQLCRSYINKKILNECDLVIYHTIE